MSVPLPVLLKPEESVRQSFRTLNRFMLLLWRLGLGSWINAWPEVGGRILVLSHTGRKSGLQRRTPVNYAQIDGEIYVTAGFGQVSDWYRNIQLDPKVEVWLPDGWYEGIAEDVTEYPEHLAILRQIMVSSGFAAYLAGIDPKRISDEALLRTAADYRLVHIHRTRPRTGPGGPGELAWVWPAATFLLLPLLFRRRWRRR